MPTYINGTKGRLFRNNYSPTIRYFGNKKIYGYDYLEKSGVNISVNNTYNDICYLKILGNTLEQGSGEKSPENPYTLKSTDNFSVITSERNLTSIPNHNVNIINEHYSGYFPQTPRVLLRPNTQYTVSFDYTVNSATGNVACGIGYGVLHYSMDIIHHQTYPNQTKGRAIYTFTTPNSFQVSLPYLQIRFARLWTAGNLDVDIENVMVAYGTDSNYVPHKINIHHFIHTLRSLPDGTTDFIEIDNLNKTAKLTKKIELVSLPAGMTWNIDNARPNSSICSTHLKNTNLSGNVLISDKEIPETFDLQYQLSSPIVTNLSDIEIQTYYKCTNINTDCEISPTLSGKFRVME